MASADHLRGGPVVTHQPYDRGARVARAEVEQIARGRAGEGIDGLARVADHAQLVVVPEPLVEQRLLQGADVLVFIDDDVVVLPADRGRDRRMVGEQADGEQQDILEVDDRALALDLLVDIEQPDEIRRVEAGRRYPPGPLRMRRDRPRGRSW